MASNMLVDGEWRTDVREMTDDDGSFQRTTTSFRDAVRDDPDARFRPETGRYHLYVARACPWAHGAALVRRLTGLEDVITMDVVEPVRENDGWEFSPEKEGCTADSILGADYLREVYVAADADYTGRVTVPVLWDRETETIVNNESIEIMRALSTAFGELGNGVDLYPEGLREEIDEVVDAVYDPINNGVYRAGFADSQRAHETAVEELFDALDRWNDHLADRRYLVGDRLTLADLRLFATLVRFDEVYHTHFKCNRARVVDYEHLWGFTRDLYRTPGVAETVDVPQIKEHYYRSHTSLNPERLVPVGPDPAFDADHDRDRLPGSPPEPLVGTQAAD
ncbi:glutathione-dependent reductase [Halobacteriales archaeon SW_12_71_31]|nr:MAG: glutathione-dependent reductase [Halobacteriales archaeon SW_12_71_31]